jgi:hypothetical protein
MSDSLKPPNPAPSAGAAERVGMLGGDHSIVSAPGQGTKVTIVLPTIRNSTDTK